MADLIQLRRDSKANWELTNPILAEGELGIETDTRKQKVGDGIRHWNNLPYMSGSEIDDEPTAGSENLVKSGGVYSADLNLLRQIGYFICDTASATAAKTIAATGYALTTGGNIRIKMTNANTVDAVTLNINSTGAKALFYNGTQASSTNSWEAGEVIEVYYDGTQFQSTLKSEYDEATMLFSKSLRDTISQAFVSKSGGYYKSSGVFVERNGSQYTELMTVPPKATKAYYTGVSYGSADGGIVWYDENKRNIGYFTPNISNIVIDEETSIPSGAAFYKASTYRIGDFDVVFDTPKYNIEQVIEQIEKNADELAEQADGLAKQADELAEQDAVIKSLVYENFEEYSQAIEIPQAQTETAGLPASGIFGMVLANTSSIKLSTIRFYSSKEKTSFVIGVGSANVEEKTYIIDKSWTIEANISIGENTIDVSSYGIVIPPKALIGCSAPTDYRNGVIAGVSKMVGAISLMKGYKGTYDRNFDSNYINITYIGTEERYSVNVPESSLALVLRGNILYGKKYVAIGDSFTAPIGSETIEVGPYKGQSKVYPYIIGNRNNMIVLNQGASGTVLNGYIANSRYTNIPQDVDYITIWYGINDAGHRIQIGTIDDEVETISAEKDTTTCGGFNWIFKWLLTNRPFAHIGVIVTDFTSAERREAIIACCQKWGIPYLDLYDPTVPMIRTRGTTQYAHSTSIAPLGYVEVCAEAKALRNTVFSTDPSHTNMHPNNDCHEWQSTIIENFMRGL